MAGYRSTSVEIGRSADTMNAGRETRTAPTAVASGDADSYHARLARGESRCADVVIAPEISSLPWCIIQRAPLAALGRLRSRMVS